jgi:hypothetical protein
MAYKTSVSKYCANRQAALTEIFTQLESMGWTLVDGNFTSKVIAYTGVDVTNDLFTSVGHGLANGTPCQITSTGTMPGGLAIVTQYYVVNQTADTFKLATTYNGTAINITSQGTGNHTISESWRIYKSNGENSDKIYEYVKISYLTANIIYVLTAYYYNIATKTIVGNIYSITPNITTSETGFYIFVHGNKNLVAVTSKISATYTRALFGHFPKIMGDTTVTTLTNSIAVGSGVTITVASTSGFDITTTYQIIGASGEGRDPITISSITNSTQMVVTSVPRSYGSGALIGAYPSTFGALNTNTINFYWTSPISITGIADCANYTYGSIYLKDLTSIAPDFRSKKYILQPLMFQYVYDGLSGSTSYGAPYCDEFILQSPTVGLTSEDTFAVNTLVTGTSTGSNTSSILNDTSKTWTVNAYTNKVVIITAGIGVGQIKKIASNTATSLTLDDNWTFEVIPTVTSIYSICDEGYRYLMPNMYIAAREGY